MHAPPYALIAGDTLIVAEGNKNIVTATSFAPRSLKSLADFNAERRAAYERTMEPHLNGIACPDCGAELVDVEPSVQLMSLPPQMTVHCPGCGWRGTRVA